MRILIAIGVWYDQMLRLMLKCLCVVDLFLNHHSFQTFKVITTHSKNHIFIHIHSCVTTLYIACHSAQIAVKIQMLIANTCWTFSYDLK